MEREDAATARVGIEAIGEEGLGAGALVGERQRRFPRRETERNAGDIFGGLLFDAAERGAFGLGFDRADGFAVHEERVIGLAGFEGQLADGDSVAAVRLIWLLV